MAVIHCHSSKVFLEHCASLGATVCVYFGGMQHASFI